MPNDSKPRGPRERGGREPERSDANEGDYPVIAKLRGARWVGSAPPTAQAFARALAQWQRLPGAVGTAATDLGNAAAPPPAAGQTREDDVP